MIPMVILCERRFSTVGLILSGCTAVGRGNLRCYNPLVLNIRIYALCVVDSTKGQLKFLPKMCQLWHIIQQHCVLHTLALLLTVLCFGHLSTNTSFCSQYIPSPLPYPPLQLWFRSCNISTTQSVCWLVYFLEGSGSH